MIPVIQKNILINSGLRIAADIHYQCSAEELIKHTLELGQGVLSDTGALVVQTGEFTGRSPKDKFIVSDDITRDVVDWNEFNIPIGEKYFDRIYARMMDYLESRVIWVRDCFACSDPAHQLSLRVINENPCGNLFAHNMFLRPKEDELENFLPAWHVIQAPGFHADPLTDGTRQGNFAIVSFTRKTILIGGTAYTGEIKKGIFSVLNFLLPHNKNVLSMHCAANSGVNGDTAIFFGLSGTGKTTLSINPHRRLIGDDEHGWTTDTVFNFEGGCYAKTINLSSEKEPEIYQAIRSGALLENVSFYENSNRVNFASSSITQNARVSYPLDFLPNALEPAIGESPKHIFFLSADAYGILPPISKLSPEQAMYQFISGYTAKLAGTESGVTSPEATFSACFGAPFLPLHPGRYAEMLGKKMKASTVNVWLVNTGWTGGPYGTGQRIKLDYTRAMISAALEGKLEETTYERHPVFGMLIPAACPGVPSEILDPKNTWSDKPLYDIRAKELAHLFINNFEKYSEGVSEAVRQAAPLV